MQPLDPSKMENPQDRTDLTQNSSRQSHKVLQALFETIWEEKQLPDGWAEDVIMKIPKRGALSNCNNWRGITLLSVPSKILAKLIIKRISEAVDQQLRQEQAGFRKGRGCIDQIFTRSLAQHHRTVH